MHTPNPNHPRLTGMLVACVALAFQVGLAIDSASRLLDADQQVARPWTSRRFARLVEVTNPLVPTGDLHAGDRILAINDRPLTNRVVEAEAFDSVAPGEFLAITVEHAAGEQTPVETMMLSLFGGLTQFALVGRETIWLTSVVWPIVCTLLAVYLLLSSPVIPTSWLLAGVLLFFAQLGRISLADPLLWPEPLRSGSVVYQNLVSWPGILWLILLILYFPGRLWPPSRSRYVVAVATLIIAVLTIVQLIGSLGEVFSYRAVEWIEPYGRTIHSFSLNLLLYTLTALVLVTAFHSSRPLYSFRQILAFRFLRTFLMAAFVALTLGTALASNYGSVDDLPRFRWLGAALYSFVLAFPIGLVWIHQAKRIIPARLALRERLLSVFGRDRRGVIDRLFANEARRDAALRSWQDTVLHMHSDDTFEQLKRVLREVVDMDLHVVHWRQGGFFRVFYVADGVTFEGQQTDIPVDDPVLDAHRREIETGDWDGCPDPEGYGRRSESGAPASHTTVNHPIGRDCQLVGILTLSLKTDGSVFNEIDSARLNKIGDCLAARLESKPPCKPIIPEA